MARADFCLCFLCVATLAAFGVVLWKKQPILDFFTTTSRDCTLSDGGPGFLVQSGDYCSALESDYGVVWLTLDGDKYCCDDSGCSSDIAADTCYGCLGTGCSRACDLTGSTEGFYVESGDYCSVLMSTYGIESLTDGGTQYCCDGCSTDLAAETCYGCTGSGCPSGGTSPAPPPPPPAPPSPPSPPPSPPRNSPLTTPVVGAYIGALPQGRTAPSLTSLPSSINYVLLSFAKADSTGTFTAFDGWADSGISATTVAASRSAFEKATGKERVFVVSLGGAKADGGTFENSVSTDEWISNAYTSVASIIEAYGAQGAEVQFEGGTSDSDFVTCVDGLLAKLKVKGYITAVGPYYGGTSSDYSKLDDSNIDAVDMQMYANNCNEASCIETNTQAAIKESPGGVSKFVFGLCSAGSEYDGPRYPDPQVGLAYLETLAAQGALGMFSWDAEDDVTMSPEYCLEDLGAEILAGGSPDVSGCKTYGESR